MLSVPWAYQCCRLRRQGEVGYLLELLPQGSIDLTRLAEEEQCDLYDAFHLQMPGGPVQAWHDLGEVHEMGRRLVDLRQLRHRRPGRSQRRPARRSRLAAAPPRPKLSAGTPPK